MAMQKKKSKNGKHDAFEEFTGGTPKFDFADVSYKESRKLTRLQHELEALQRRKDEGPLDELEDVLDAIEDVLDAQEEYICKLLVDVPRAWLVSSAPSEIDWSDRESLQFLRGDKWRALAEALQEAQREGN